MNLFKIETGTKNQGAEVSPSASLRTGGKGSVANCEAGFTLVEIIVVVVIIGILVIMAYATLRTPNEKIACKEIYSKMQLAKMQAVSTGTAASVDLDTVFDVSDLDVPGDVDFLTTTTPYTAPNSLPGGEASFPADGKDFGGDNTVFFNSKGMAQDGANSEKGAVYMVDPDNTDRICAVTVLFTGIIRVWTSTDHGTNWN